jgi:OOP family OmpA-OmpF porin
MNYRPIFQVIIVGLFVFGYLTMSATAAEIITVDDFEQKIVTKEDFIKTADNVIILFDASISMNETHINSGKSRYELAKKFLEDGNNRLPDLGYNMGIYVYTPWTPIYPMQPYDKQKVADALQTLPDKPDGVTYLVEGLKNLKPILENLSGHTVVFLFTDGSYTKTDVREPSYYAKELAENHDICFYIISSANSEVNEKMLEKVSSYNPCSRVIPFDEYIIRPEYNSGALYVVRSTLNIVTINDQKVVGLKTDNILFKHNKHDIQPVFYQELDEIGQFVAKHPESYIVLHGYTDDVGSQTYNLSLSQKRVESVYSYFTGELGVDHARVITMWYGEANPIASNSNDTGRALNRRVEIAVGGLM